MDNNTNIVDTENTDSGFSLIGILTALRVHIFLIIAVTVFFFIAGFAYSRIRKPIYTASVPAQFNAEIKDTEGEMDVVSSVNYIFASYETVVKFCEYGAVIDRANVYYNYYLTEKRNGTVEDIDEFIAKLTALYDAADAETGLSARETRSEVPGYAVTEDLMNEYRGEWFNGDNTGANFASTKEQTTLFHLWVKNANRNYAMEMARIYVFSADVAFNLLDFGAESHIQEMNSSVYSVSVSPDVSTRRIVAISTAIGIVLSLLTVYLIYLLDNTVKTKEQMERLTGATLLGYVEDMQEA